MDTNQETRTHLKPIALAPFLEVGLELLLQVLLVLGRPAGADEEGKQAGERRIVTRDSILHTKNLRKKL